jgi:hypothetical protein
MRADQESKFQRWRQSLIDTYQIGGGNERRPWRCRYAQQPCLLCGRKPSDPHHLRHLEPRALGRKASDEFAAPSVESIVDWCTA